MQLHPNTDALVALHQGLSLTWRQLHAAAEEAAYGLLALGVQVRQPGIPLWWLEESFLAWPCAAWP